MLKIDVVVPVTMHETFFLLENVLSVMIICIHYCFALDPNLIDTLLIVHETSLVYIAFEIEKLIGESI